MVKKPLLCACILVCPVAVALGVVLRLKLACEQLVEEYCIVCHYFSRLYAAQLVHKLGCILFPAVFVYVKCACGNVAVSKAEIAVAEEAMVDEVDLPEAVAPRARSANAKALLAAAQAFSERQRMSGLAA